MKAKDTARALFLELVARGVCVHTGAVSGLLSPDEAGTLLGRVHANGAGLQKVLSDRRDPHLEAVRQEGGAS